MKKTVSFDIGLHGDELDSIVYDLHIQFGKEKLLAIIIDHVGIDAYLDYALRHHEKEFDKFYEETHEPEDKDS